MERSGNRRMRETRGGKALARINIEDSIHSDCRFIWLCNKLGSEDLAVGMLYRFWRYAQRFWIDGERLIPVEFFELAGLEPILEVDLAEKREGGIYAKGAIEQFTWLQMKKEMSKRAALKRWENTKLMRTHNERIADEMPNAFPPAPAPAPALNTNTMSPKAPDLLRLWNDNCGTLPKLKTTTEKRGRAWRARWNSKPDEAYWIETIRLLAANSFCNGFNNRNWRATIDFLLRPDTHVKVHEGIYNGNQATKKEVRHAF